MRNSEKRELGLLGAQQLGEKNVALSHFCNECVNMHMIACPMSKHQEGREKGSCVSVRKRRVVIDLG